MDNIFRVLHVDLTAGKSTREEFSGRDKWLGGSGLSAFLFSQFADFSKDPLDPVQPLIFAVGPLTGFYPMMSKTVCGFFSPYHGQYAESHAGGRSALGIRLAGLDAVVLTGQAAHLSSLVFSAHDTRIVDTHFLAGMDIFSAGKLLRKIKPAAPGHRSIMRIGPAGENQCAFACINVDTYRHFGRLGSGAVMGSKNIKAVIISGDGHADLPEDSQKRKKYFEHYNKIYQKITETGAVSKYHDLGTAENLIPLNELKALPWRNLKQSSDPDIEGISGEKMAEDLLLRQTACAGCPVGCIHIGLLREKFGPEHEYLYRQVAYDYEPVFAVGSMLGIVDAGEVLTLIEDVERAGLDVISTGVALAWATEAAQKKIISVRETIAELGFGHLSGYRKAIYFLAEKENEFYAALSRGTLAAADKYGGRDFACVLGQEMAGYATGEAYYVSQALGFRHSHLDSGAYGFDQSEKGQNTDLAVNFMLEQENYRNILCSMVGCLFARKAYPLENMVEACSCLGFDTDPENLQKTGKRIQSLRWKLRFKSGFNPEEISIPERYLEVENFRGKTDPEYMQRLKEKYAARIRELAGMEI
ncbi:MAG: aldehyde ferredoxin oxidoreductase N-terminal domain-containing protein [Thermodesulfobacteriota bacterium]